MTVLVWVQHLLGTGHLRRALGLARAIAARGLPVVVASGGPPTAFTVPDGVRFVQLPQVTAGPGGFADLRTSGGAAWSADDRQQRTAVVQDLVARTAPAVLVTEMFPFGRRMFRDELLPAIRQVKQQGGRVACSVRDILVAKHDERKVAEMAATAEQLFDAVLVHGDARFVPFGHTFPLAARLAGILHHTGFIVDQPLAPVADRSGGEVLVSAGGGRVGRRLLEAAAQSRQLTGLASHSWRLVGGHALAAADRARLDALLGQPGTTHGHLPDLALRLSSCRLSVSQAGYNTVVEALMAGAPMVLVPYAEGGESEQATRALALAALGRAEVVAEDGLTPTALAAAVDRAATQDVSIGRDWSFDGAERSAELLVELARAS